MGLSGNAPEIDASPPADLLSVIAHIPAGVAVFDRDMVYLAASRRYLQDARVAPDTPVVGRCHYEVFGEVPQRWRELHRQVIREGLTLRADQDSFTRSNGDVEWVRWELTPWRSPEGVIGGLVLYRELVTPRVEARMGLEAAEARYRAVFDQAAVGVARVSPEGRLLEVNDRFCAITGYARGELVGLGFQQITDPADLESDILQADALLAGEIDTYAMEKRYIAKGGAVVWVNLTVSLVRTAAGEPDYFVAVIEDINERRLANDALRASEARFRLLAELSPDAIVISRHDRFVYANPAAVRLYGVAGVEDLVGRDPGQFTPPENRAEVAERVARVMAGQKLGTAEIDIVRPDGARLPVEVSAGLIEWEGEPAIEVLLRDISGRRAAEAALQESRQRAREQLEELEAVYETSPVGLAFLTPDLRFVRVNRRLAEMNGVPAADHVGRTVAEVAPGISGQVEQILRRLDAGEPVVSYEVTGETAAAPGAPRAWLEYWRPVHRPGGGLRGYNVVVEEITERKLAEDRRKLLLDELNHRVKNTLAVVQSVARQTLVGETVSPAARTAFEDRLHALAAAHTVLTRESWESAELHEIVALATRSQGQGRVTVEGPPVALRPGPAVSLSLALHELATNAVKYGALSASGGEVRVAWAWDGADQPTLKIRWEERGGPPVAAPARRGFGSRLLERALSAELDGAVRLSFRPEGVVCDIESRALGLAPR